MALTKGFNNFPSINIKNMNTWRHFNLSMTANKIFERWTEQMKWFASIEHFEQKITLKTNVSRNRPLPGLHF